MSAASYDEGLFLPRVQCAVGLVALRAAYFQAVTQGSRPAPPLGGGRRQRVEKSRPLLNTAV